MGDSNASIANSLYESWNARDFDRFVGMFTDDAEIVIVGAGETLRGREGALQFAQMWAGGFPDGRVQIDRVIADGDTTAVEFTGRGTHTGTLAGPTGEIPATGRQVTLQLCDVHELEGGKIRRFRTYFDTAALLGQLGLIPTPEGTAV